jgi:hypothetical protein
MVVESSEGGKKVESSEEGKKVGGQRLGYICSVSVKK